MSTLPPVPPAKSKPSAPPPAPKAPTPARRRASSVPLAQQKNANRRDWWPWNLMAGLVVAIGGIGLLVWGLRSGITAPPPTAVPAIATPLAAAPTRPPASGTALVQGVSTPTLAAPDALTNGPYAEVTPIDSVVSTTGSHTRPTLPPQIPGPHIAFSQSAQDWGEIAATDAVTHVITLANVGNRALHIDQVLSTCTCLSATMSSTDLPVGYRALLAVVYDPRLDGQKGLVTRTLTILSTAADDPIHELVFKATVR